MFIGNYLDRFGSTWLQLRNHNKRVRSAERFSASLHSHSKRRLATVDPSMEDERDGLCQLVGGGRAG